MNDYIYSIQQIKQAYNGRTVLQVDDYKIKKGEVLALVGPSGAGKSTLLRLLNFLEPPTMGKIQFKETIFSTENDMPLKLRRQVTTVFQRPSLLNRTVLANVNYGLRLRGWREKSNLVHTTLDQLGLDKVKDQRTRTLSGGEAQRVALARALVLKPEVLLLDEPTANLDPYNVGLIEENVIKLNREHGATLVLVTHNVFQARRLADRVSLLLEGRIIETSDVDTFFNRPRDPRTAAFVRGDMVY
ncbi:MAG: phosphate ABC transporter ATP-binding protein [Anaerolineales bacterium]|nr:phosphate ABC transporter ATP-binding protein [Anaerolineales bacterium]